MKVLFSMAMMLLVAVSAFAQYTVTGTVIDAESGEPIIGCAVMEAGTANGMVTDIDGNFTLKVSNDPAVIKLSYLGYQTVEVNASKSNTNLGTIKLASDSKALADVVVVSQIAVARKTPVAMSSISPELIDEKLGGREFVEILKSTPGVHPNEQGGGYGDSEVYMRGFDGTNTATLVNGVPVNDMENGTVYQSNWMGLDAVCRSVQTQRGLGASKVSSPSVGGTYNYVLKGLEAKKGGFVSYAIGSNEKNDIRFSFSTGMNEKGWALTLLGGKTWGNGDAQGLDFKGYTYFMNLSKRLSDSQQISFMIYAAPQEHAQRNFNYGALTVSEWKKAEKVYGIKDFKYNSAFGYDKNGQVKYMNYNVYHKPLFNLNHQWNINDYSSLSTIAYVSLGRGYGYSGEANGNIGNYSYNDFRGAYQGKITTKFRKEDGTFDYAAMEEINANSEHGSAYVMSKSLNYHNWYGLVSTYTTSFLDCIDFYAGVDYRYYEGLHTNEIVDLYGGKYYVDETRKNSVTAANNKRREDDNWVYEKLGVGDVIYRDYTGYVMQEGGFFQGEYNKEALSAFVAGSISNTTYWRYDRYYYDKEHAKSDKVNYIGFTVKGGANYNFNDNHNAFVNVGYISRAPKFSYGAFMNSSTSNVLNPDAKNEKVASFEVGYGFKSRHFNANVNGYYTKWMDKTMTKSGTLGQAQTEYNMNMTGVDALHKGIEVEMKAPLTSWLELTGMLSVGDWKWDSNAKGYAYDEHGNALNTNGEITQVKADDHAWAIINLKGVEVGGSAQTTAAFGANFKMDGLKFGADWNMYARNYTYYSFSGSNLTIGKETNISHPYELPVASDLDAFASYTFSFGGLKAVFTANMSNVLDNHYMVKASNPSVTSEATADNIYGFFHTGRKLNFKLKLNF